MSRLILVRHAEPEEDARGRCYGSLDVGLSDAGREHAGRLAVAARAGRVRRGLLEPAHARARDRGADRRALGREPVVDDDLRELDFGELEGRTYDEIAATRPGALPGLDGDADDGAVSRAARASPT